MNTKRILLSITIVLFVFHVFYQTENDSNQPGFNWYHMDMTLTKIPKISTNRAYDELVGNLYPETVIEAVLDAGVDVNHVDLKDNIWTNVNDKFGKTTRIMEKLTIKA